VKGSLERIRERKEELVRQEEAHRRALSMHLSAFKGAFGWLEMGAALSSAVIPLLRFFRTQDSSSGEGKTGTPP
jgi:hypothetical protein